MHLKLDRLVGRVSGYTAVIINIPTPLVDNKIDRE